MTVSTKSTVASTIVVSGIHYDVASTVASGTTVAVTATVSSGKLVNPSSRTNAVVGRVFNASAPTPNVNIGQNGQTAGLITITEVTAGSFTDGTGPNNVFEVCPDLTASFTSPGPSAFVTGGVAAGNLILRDGAAASTTNIVAGTPDPAHFGCYYWTVWTASTTASTITIGSSATVGPLVNVNPGFPPGALNAILYVGALATIQSNQGVTLAIANRVFPGQVKVTAVSQPAMAPGSSNQLAGNILIQETGNGQLKNGTDICIEIVPNQNTGTLTDAYLTDLFTADLPVATGANGVVVNAVRVTPGRNCDGSLLSGLVGSLTGSVRFMISQQSTTGNGSVTISNLHYNVLNDAATGPVQVNVFGYSVGGASIDFQSDRLERQDRQRPHGHGRHSARGDPGRCLHDLDQGGQGRQVRHLSLRLRRRPPPARTSTSGARPRPATTGPRSPRSRPASPMPPAWCTTTSARARRPGSRIAACGPVAVPGRPPARLAGSRNHRSLNHGPGPRARRHQQGRGGSPPRPLCILEGMEGSSCSTEPVDAGLVVRTSHLKQAICNNKGTISRIGAGEGVDGPIRTPRVRPRRNTR